MNDFDEWNEIKKKINAIRSDEVNRFLHRGDVWWCNLGKNVGFEQNGRGKDYSRPIIILKVLSPNTIFAVPLTTSKDKHYFSVNVGKIDDKLAKAVTSQAKVIDTRRLQEKICRITDNNLRIIRKTIKEYL